MISMLLVLFREEYAKHNMAHLLKLAGDILFLSALACLALDVNMIKSRFARLFMKSITSNMPRSFKFAK